MSMSSGCLLEPATGFAGLLMTMASLIGLVCAFAASDNWSSSVYCSKVPDNGAVVDSTALTGCCQGTTCFPLRKHLGVQSFSNSDLGHLWHSLDSNRLRVPETLWSTSYSEPLPAVPNTTVRSLHSNPSSDTPSEDYSETSTSSEGSSETSLDSIPSDPNSALTFLRDSPSRSGDKAAPAASNIKGCVIKVIRDI